MVYPIAFLSFFLCLALTPAVRYIAAQRGWMACPVKDRWHKKPTALMGGIAIYLSTAIPLFFVADFSGLLSCITGITGEEQPLPDAVIWIGMTLLFVLGLVDDVIRLRPQTKLVGQILVASMAAFLGFRLHWFTSLTLDTVVTIVWIVGLTNAFNLIDNMDGLCTGVALIAALYFSLLLPGSGGGMAALFLAGALAGFLVYNFNPASIFMGDCGSLMIGFALAMMGLHYSETAQCTMLATIAVPVMVLMVPILDTTLVTLIRLLSGRKASVGGKDHTSHRLVLMGFSERGAALFLYFVGSISGVAALFVDATDSLTSPAAIIPLAIAILLMGIYMAQIRVYPEKEFSLLRNRAYTPILIELTYRRQLTMVVLDFCLIAFSYYLSYRLRFNSADFAYYFQVFLHSLPAIIACKLIAFFILGIYRGIWRYMSSNDVFIYLRASAMATLFSVVAVTYIYRFRDFSKGIFVIDWLLTTGLLLGTRGSFRISLDAMNRKSLSGEKVLIYGAGRGGEILLREILNNRRHAIQPVGFIDDDTLKTGRKLQGYPILGTFRDVDRLLNEYHFKGMLISFNGSVPNNLDGAMRFCDSRRLFLKRFSICLEPVETEGVNNR
ncbi:glycosyl transferase [Desulfonema ishimotonii]|uniref:Glycosyl transferase n=1 Tax=Desulfonema ishimotonii TaxID=45657 RepID=A0A401G354_9BACT|nr:glycosyl transferase [Desulfonema ishimotonii]GBC63623.1 glycosyl transferase [Desulfonema ishimotonii]